MSNAPARPLRNHPQVIAFVAAKLEKDVNSWLQVSGDSDEESCLETLTDVLTDTHSSDWDGYKLARALEDEGWSPDHDLVSTLDRADHFAYDEHHRLVKDWVASNGIQAKLELGREVTTRIGFEKKTGTIIKIDALEARYHIQVPPQTDTSAYLVNFEEVEKENL